MDIETTPRPETPRRSPWRVVVRVILSVTMLGVIIWRVPHVSLDDVVPTWRSTTPVWLAGAATAMLGAFALSTLRWRQVVDALATSPPFRRLFSHFLAGQFVSNVLPTAFGGDVVRVSRLGRDIGSMPRSFASVVIERLTGWLVLPAISMATLVSQPRFMRLGDATTTALVVNGVTVVALLMVITLASNRRLTADLDETSGWRSFLLAVHLGLDALRRHPRDAVGVLVAGVAFQLMQCVAVWMAAQGIGLHQVSITAALAFFPAVAILQNLPVGIGGLGIREGAFIVFYGALGAPRGAAIGLGLTIYVLHLVTSALGAPSFAFGSRTPTDPVPRIPSEASDSVDWQDQT